MISFHEVGKTYRDRVVLDGVTFTAPSGAVTGLLGPNGAGKSTALRILLGLSTADTGDATVDGHDYRSLGEPARIVGALLDATAVHPGRTGREVLRLGCHLLGLPGPQARRRIDAVLAEVGLTVRESRQRLRTYSLGMKQRLGLAHALLGDPAALVLDEPANGLDPQGQRWLAQLLRDRAERGCAVLLSSHQLAEVERLADRLVIIADGRVLADDRVAALQETHGDVTELYFRLTSGLDRSAA